MYFRTIILKFITAMKTRFNVSKVLSYVAASAVLIALMFSCANPTEIEEEQKEIGLQLWSIRNDMKENVAATIDSVGAMGYTFVEAAGYGDGQFYGMEPVAFKDLLADNGLEMLSSHTGPHLPAPEEWDSVMAWWDQAIHDHLAVGVKYIVKPSLGKDAFESLENLQKYCNYFNAIGEKCNAEGVKFGFHNHAREFDTLQGEVIFDYMLQNTDPEKVFYQMDLYWVVEGGADPIEYFEKYPGRFLLWHVKDEAEVGASGKIDFERIFQYTEESGVEEIIVEVEDYNYTPLQSVEKSLKYLQQADFVPDSY